MILIFANCSMLNYPLLHVSRMVRPAGRGRGANDPPPPEFFAGMMQQFELNRQFMEGMMTQFPLPNMNQQPTPVTLQDFLRRFTRNLTPHNCAFYFKEEKKKPATDGN